MPGRDALPRTETRVFGFAVTMADAAGIARAVATERRDAAAGVGLVVTPNLDHVVQLRRDAGLARAYRRAEIVACDGFPVRWYSRFRGIEAGAATGCDIAAALMRANGFEQWQRLFFVVDGAATDAGVRGWAARKGIADRVATCVPPPGFQGNPGFCADLAARISAHGTTVLVMGVGAPRSEIFVDSHRDRLPPCWALCVGQAVKVEVGVVRRAPGIVRRLYGEWAWRMAQEPRRLARRYLLGSTLFLLAVAEDLSDARLRRLAWRRVEEGRA